MKELIRAGITAPPLFRTVLLVIVCAATLVLPGKSAFSQNWYNSSWLYRQGITIDSDNVDFSLSGSLSQFPVLISLTDGSNSLFGNAQPDGDDILFTASDGHTKIPHEIQAYDDTGGSEELLAWVRVPTFNNGSNTVIYMYYGNASASSQETPSSVWDSNFKGVWHLEESAAGVGTADLYQDSTSNNNHGDDQVAHAGKAGRIGNGQQFDGVGDYIDCGNDGSLNVNNLTIEVWIYSTGFAVNGGIVSKGLDAFRQYWTWTWGGNGSYEIDNDVNVNDAWLLSTDQWQHMALTWDGTNVVTYLNGTLGVSNGQGTGNIDPTVEPLLFGYIDGYNYWDGNLDEVRLSSIARSADWIKASYVSQNNPEAYLTFQAEGTEPAVEDRVIIKNNIINPNTSEYTTLNFTLDTPTKVTVTVYDLAGDPVDVLYDQTGSVGLNEVIWDGKNRRGRAVVPGVYYVVVKIQKQRYVEKVLVIK